MYINYVFIGSFPTFASRSEPGRDWWHPANVKSDRRKHSAPSGQNNGSFFYDAFFNTTVKKKNLNQNLFENSVTGMMAV